MGPRILLVEDDPGLRLTLTHRLGSEGYRVETAGDGEEGLARAVGAAFDLLILDVMLPRKSGFDVLRDLRQRGIESPVLMLTARSQVADRVVGLKLGADDYLTKPFAIRELIARVAAILRRTQTSSRDVSGYDDGELRIDEKAFRVYHLGQEVKLAKKEMELLLLLVRNRGNVISRDRILSEVWQMSDDVETRTVDAHIRNLRKKIGTERITTVVGFGYRYDPPT